MFVAAPSSWRIRSAPAARPRPIFGSQCVFSVFSVCFQCYVREFRTACGLCFLSVFCVRVCVLSVTLFPVCFQCVFAFHERVYFFLFSFLCSESFSKSFDSNSRALLPGFPFHVDLANRAPLRTGRDCDGKAGDGRDR